MRIGFCGSNSTGKTTLLNGLREGTQLKDYVFVDEITRSIGNLVPINEDGDTTTQLLVMNSHIQNLLMENFVADRCMIDGYVYTAYLYEEGKLPEWVLSYAYQVMLTYIEKYDHIFYIPIEIPLEDDGVRSNSEEFRNKIDEIMKSVVVGIQTIRDIKITTITGSVEERLQTIINTVT